MVGIKLTFHDFKHNYNQLPFTLTINRQSTCCPIQLLIDYLALRQLRPRGHLCGRGEEIDDTGTGCKNLQDSWRFSSMRRQ